MGTTRAGNRCSRNVPGMFCHQHAPAMPVEAAPAEAAPAEAAPAEAAVQPAAPIHQPAAPAHHQCEGILRGGRRCSKRATTGHFCRSHERIPDEGVDPELVEMIRHERLEALDRAGHLWNRWNDTMDVAFYQDWVATSLRFRELDDEFREFTITPMQLRVRRELHMQQLEFHHQHQATVGALPIWQDTQSIHRKEVSEQTNALLTSMLGENPESFKEDTWLPVAGWLGAPVGGQLRRDMKVWYDQAFCKQENDFLYRRILNAVVDYARKHKEHEELRRRLYEETTESIGMCCEGHIARLCNSLVGYHEDAVSPVSPKEVLQERMAALAARGGTSEEGKAILTELSIPPEQWDDWLAAL
jgi:hypothetical protein